MSEERVEGCPCGLTGDDCTELVPPLVAASGALEENCFAEGFDECFVQRDEAFCVCKCGFSGDLCETVNEPLIGNFLGGFVLGVMVMFLASSYLYWKYQRLRRAGKETGYGYSKGDIVTSRFSCVTPLMLLVYRATLGLVFFLPIYISAFIDNTLEQTLTPFTYFNWVIFGTLNAIGAFLGFLHWLNPSKSEQPAGCLQLVYVVLFEVLWPSTIVIAIVVWGVLLPSALAVGQEDGVLTGRSYFTHGVNAVLLTFDFCVNKIYLKFHHVWYIVIWAAFYGTFHICYMFVREVLDEDHCPAYGFLGMENRFFVVNLVVLLVLFALVFCFTFGLSSLKKRFDKKRSEKKILEEK